MHLAAWEKTGVPIGWMNQQDHATTSDEEDFHAFFPGIFNSKVDQINIDLVTRVHSGKRRTTAHMIEMTAFSISLILSRRLMRKHKVKETESSSLMIIVGRKHIRPTRTTSLCAGFLLSDAVITVAPSDEQLNTPFESTTQTVVSSVLQSYKPLPPVT